jgi:hypothetical protein
MHLFERPDDDHWYRMSPLNSRLYKSHGYGDLSTHLSPAMASLVVSSTMILSTQLESPRLAKDLEDCRKTCLSVVSVHERFETTVPSL